ncbi:MAG: cytochrome c biogenesis protein CcdA, partial [Lapillicoccus sp.]
MSSTLLPLALAESPVATAALPLAVVVALAAGLVSFASPCVLPLVPGFLGYVTGLSDVALERRRRASLVLGAGLFVLGFTVVFILLVALASAVSFALREHLDLLTRIGGGVVVLLALVFLGVGTRFGTQRTTGPRWRPAAGRHRGPVVRCVPKRVPTPRNTSASTTTTPPPMRVSRSRCSRRANETAEASATRRMKTTV